jgi:alkanesulfonate monooxygenase SsuD/methylene tetrahydromethanopterin reductase-like flavin-dependent oxidoreductase (luciferase family)
MPFGLFGGPQADGDALGAGVVQNLHDDIAYGVEAEALRFRSTFLVEHDFTSWEQASATLTLLAWFAARIKSLRLGTAVLVLPWHDPVLLAERAATLDPLSGERLEFGVGKGYWHNEFAGFCMPISESQARFVEALDLIAKSWISMEWFSCRGRLWRFEDTVWNLRRHSGLNRPSGWRLAARPRSVKWRSADRICCLTNLPRPRRSASGLRYSRRRLRRAAGSTIRRA